MNGAIQCTLPLVDRAAKGAIIGESLSEGPSVLSSSPRAYMDRIMNVTKWLAVCGILLGTAPAAFANDNTQAESHSPQAKPVESTGSEKSDKSRRLAPRREESWMTMIVKAYPVEAARRGQEGTVGVTVSVTAYGQPKDCKVTKSSGHELLDTAACAGMLRYARFDPALDADGNTISADFATEVKYTLDG